MTLKNEFPELKFEYIIFSLLEGLSLGMPRYIRT